MRLLIQRVSRAHVDVAGERVASIGAGFMVLAGFGPDDVSVAEPGGLPATKLWKTMLDKLTKLRVFPDEAGKMNLSLTDDWNGFRPPDEFAPAPGAGSRACAGPDSDRSFGSAEGPSDRPSSGGEMLLVPQFTLYADCKGGYRPSFSKAAPPEAASALFDRLCDDVEARLPGRTARGVFGADMAVGLVNRGPVTILLDSADFA